MLKDTPSRGLCVRVWPRRTIAIDQCIETFDKRLRKDEERRDKKRRAKQVERAKKCPPEQSNKRAKRPRKQSD